MRRFSPTKAPVKRDWFDGARKWSERIWAFVRSAKHRQDAYERSREEWRERHPLSAGRADG